MDHSAGPLSGIQIIEFAGIGPAPFAAMILSDLGAEVIRIDRPTMVAGRINEFRADVLNRGRKSISLDLKNDSGLNIARKLIADADGLIEGFRPGVMERLGLGPSTILDLNPRLTYVRMTGWGQSGPLSSEVGHDLNYIAITGLLNAIGPKDSPSIPLNVVGDFGAGASIAVIGMISGILSSKLRGTGCVVDSAIVDGAVLMSSMTYALMAMGSWKDERASNLLDGGAPFYNIYRCLDGKFVSVGALEPEFYSDLLSGLELENHPAFVSQYEKSRWPEMSDVLSRTFSQRDARYFNDIFRGTKACVVLIEDFSGARENPHLISRESFRDINGVVHPAPSPRFEGYIPEISLPPFPGEHRDAILETIGFGAQNVRALEDAGAFG